MRCGLSAIFNPGDDALRKAFKRASLAELIRVRRLKFVEVEPKKTRSF
jgi:hypothetical protein